MRTGSITERTLYAPMMEVIRESGGSGVSEISFNSVPDILFDLQQYKWILSVKIGQDPATIKSAFLQYLRHKEESRIGFGVLILFPDSIRSTHASEQSVLEAVRTTGSVALVDADCVKEEVRGYALPDLLDFLQTTVLKRVARGERTHYPLPLVISLLQRQVSEMMSELAVKESSLLRIITDRRLLMDLGHLRPEQVEDVARFLASYILLSQVLFLRLLASARPSIMPNPSTPATPHKLREAFAKVLEVNYRPIYGIEVLDAIPENFVKDVVDLIWGLEIERVRYELPGRIFHELMPSEIRKMLAAFYTRPVAADILAALTISRSGETVFDPACGSGTILASAYRQKLAVFASEGKCGNPHKRFCEEEIFGGDIMPFAVHLASANLASMDAGTPIERTQIIQGDSLDLISGTAYAGGIQQPGLFHTPPSAETTNGDKYSVELNNVDAILMNPPFTKVERGISKFVNMDRFHDAVGGEVGLWGHFVALADLLLRDRGTLGAVIPINVLRGRESEEVRRTLLERYTPLYVLKPTWNYGFSEWSEYRDVLFIARKKKPDPDATVKFCLIKKDLTRLDHEDVVSIPTSIKQNTHLRSDRLDIDSHALSEVRQRFDNLMWFCGVTDMRHRDVLLSFLKKFDQKVLPFSSDYIATGFRPDRDVSKFLFLTRRITAPRVEEAFLGFSKTTKASIDAESPLGASYRIARTDLVPSLRTLVGLAGMDVTQECDYMAFRPYRELDRVRRAAGFRTPPKFDWDRYWASVEQEVRRKAAHTVVAHRINPFSPNVHLPAFYSDDPLTPSDQFNIVCERDRKRARAICVLLNSALFFTQFFLLKEESTGRYINIRLYDLCQMNLMPSDSAIENLERVFKKFGRISFEPLSSQFDAEFEERYAEFWETRRGQPLQEHLWTVSDKPISPSQTRLEFDLGVCKALGVRMSLRELTEIYDVLVKEMIMIRGLKRD